MMRPVAQGYLTYLLSAANAATCRPFPVLHLRNSAPALVAIRGGGEHVAPEIFTAAPKLPKNERLQVTPLTSTLLYASCINHEPGRGSPRYAT